MPLYLTESYLSQGFQKASPPLLAKGVGRWLSSAALSYLYSFPFFLIYLISFLLLIFGTLKLFLPNHVQVAYINDSGQSSQRWLGIIGYTSNANDPKGHELLGPWTVPATWVLGLLTGMGATILLRWMTKRALRRRFED